MNQVALHLVIACSLLTAVSAQDASTGAIRGTVSDSSGAPIPAASVTLIAIANGMERSGKTDTQGSFSFDLIPAGDYEVRGSAPNMATHVRKGVSVDIGGKINLAITLRIAGAEESISVEAGGSAIETEPSGVSDVIDQRAMNDLPLNGRRFTDLALLTPGVTQDPRGLTSSSSGDLAFGGVRGYHSSYLVDGADNNNSFFGQARGRYRAPYQFSNEVVQQFRVSSNTYGAELGRSGGAVINVITKSGSNRTHGSLFYYLRDGKFAAIHPFVRRRYPDKQHQFGGTAGGPIKRNRVFYFVGFDQHIFHIPTVVQFVNGATEVAPTPADYEVTDQAQVFTAASQLSVLGGQFRSALLGNAAFLKIDAVLSPHHYLSGRINLSRYYGANNVFFDSASPITNFGITENGEEQVSTESMHLSLTSALAPRWNNHLRLQFSSDLQNSVANSTDVQTKIQNVIDAFGRSSILPRTTQEHKWSLAETVSFSNRRHSIKFGADISLTAIGNYFPELFGGQYSYNTIRVNPFTFVPQPAGLILTPLRAFAHSVPRFYSQNFGNASSHPDTKEYAGFIQDTVRVGNRLAFSLGARYDLQTFRSDRLVPNPLWPDSGKVPSDKNNIGPRVGFAASLGKKDNPLVIRGGYGLFYTRIPQIYNSSVETNNGISRSHLALDNTNFFARQVFPVFPNPLVSCLPGAVTCVAPDNVAGFITSEISSFASNFKIPYVQQTSLTLEKEIVKQTAVSVSYLYVAGKHLIRARDVNLPLPISTQYPVFNDSGSNFTGEFYNVQTFSSLRFSKSLTCPFPPCIDPLQRPISQLGAIDVYESAASSEYHGFTVSARRRVTNGFYFHAAYTWAKAIDDGQDALVAGAPALVQNSFNTKQDRALSVTDQRHRTVVGWSADPKPFHRDHPILRTIFNSWLISGIVTSGTGRPVTGKINGDPNQDGNTGNDRLPTAGRNAFTGPDYVAADMRLTRELNLNERFQLQLTVESFNVMNRDNKRVDITDNGFSTSAGGFVQITKKVGSTVYPAFFQKNSAFLSATNAYAPRQIQMALRLKF